MYTAWENRHLLIRIGSQSYTRKRVCLTLKSKRRTPVWRSSRLQDIEVRRSAGNEEHSQLPSPSASNPNTWDITRKRKRVLSKRSCLLEKHNQDSKRRKISQPPAEQSNTDWTNPIAHWVLTTFWPQDLWQRGSEMPDTPSSKRKNESTHRSQTLERMAAHGVFMESSNLVQKKSEKLCDEYLRGSRKIVKSSIFNSKVFSRVFDRVRNLNEARIQRDITPWVVPSAETLFFRGELNLPWIGEELDAEWIRCATMGSTRPKPDYTAGLVRNAFTEEEIKKLENYVTPTQPFHFTP